ncbi:hypothetical protein [Streptomyces sp. NPDC053427]|uniref:hypothetical protein n=1 Tax=Streptomyces sp. NPDC053427 TaxID=3365701 RepID=UPI0037D13D7A
MSGAHARPRESIQAPLWRPLAVLALVGAAPPVAIVSGAVDAHSAPAAIEQPDDPPAHGHGGAHQVPPPTTR